MFLGIFNAYDAMFLFTVSEFERVEFEMIGQQAKAYLFFPDAVGQDVAVILDSCVEKDGGMYGFSIFGCSYIYIEVKGVFSIGIDAER